MPDPNGICKVCTDGKNSDEFTICPACHGQLCNGMVGFKCLSCGEHQFMPKSKRTEWRIRRMLDLWDSSTRPRVCPHKANEVMAALKEGVGKKAIIIYFPICPKCYKPDAEDGINPAHPLAIMDYKIICFSIEEFHAHPFRGEDFYKRDGATIH